MSIEQNYDDYVSGLHNPDSPMNQKELDKEVDEEDSSTEVLTILQRLITFSEGIENQELHDNIEEFNSIAYLIESYLKKLKEAEEELVRRIDSVKNQSVVIETIRLKLEELSQKL